MKEFLSPISGSAALGRELERQAELATHRFGEMLVDEGVITQNELLSAVSLQRFEREKRLGDILVEMGTLIESDMETALAKRLGIPFVDLKNFDFDPLALSLVSSEVARKRELIPCMLHRGRLVVAVAKPLERESLELLRFITEKQIEAVMALREDILRAIAQHYPTRAEEAHPPDPAIGKFLDSIIHHAIRKKASEIRLLPTENGASIAFLISGDYVGVVDIQQKILHEIILMLKSLASMEKGAGEGSTKIMENGEIHQLQVHFFPRPQGEGAAIKLSRVIS